MQIGKASSFWPFSLNVCLLGHRSLDFERWYLEAAGESFILYSCRFMAELIGKYQSEWIFEEAIIKVCFHAVFLECNRQQVISTNSPFIDVLIFKFRFF